MKITDQQLASFREQGFFITDVLFDEPRMAALIAEFDRLWKADVARAEANGDPQRIELAKYRPFVGQVHSKSEVCQAFCRDEVFQTICRTLIGPDADLYYNQAVMKPPGKGRAFGWHQDTQYIVTEPLYYVTCWCAISRATVDNGTIWISPGDHKNGLMPHVFSKEAMEWQLQFDDSWKQPVVLRGGQIAVFNALLPHSSGPNITAAETRYSYVVQYHVPEVKHRDTKELVGDQFPLIRGGKLVG